MTHEEYGIIGLALTILGITWKFSSLATKLTDTIQFLERKNLELEAKIKNVDDIPQIKIRVEYLEKNHSIIPVALSRITTLEEKAKHSKEMRKILLERQSRPDTEGDE